MKKIIIALIVLTSIMYCGNREQRIVDQKNYLVGEDGGKVYFGRQVGKLTLFTFIYEFCYRDYYYLIVVDKDGNSMEKTPNKCKLEEN